MIHRVSSKKTLLTSSSSINRPFFTFSNWKSIKQHDNSKKLLKRHLDSDFFTSKSPDVSLELALKQLYIKSNPVKVDLKPVSISPTQKSTKNSLLTWLKSRRGNGFSEPRLEPENLQFHEPPDRRNLPGLKLNQENNSAPTHKTLMIEKPEDTFTPTEGKIIILWDLDNKTPKNPYNVTMLLTKFARLFGQDVKISAFGNSNTWSNLPRSIRDERLALQKRYLLEEQGVIAPREPYICGVCEAQYKFRKDLQTHFEIHEHEYNEMMAQITSSKSRTQRLRHFIGYEKKIDRYREAYRHKSISGIKVGLDDELERAGVVVHRVQNVPQAADRALARAWELQGSGNKGPYDWLFLVSDDTDFCSMLDNARKRGVGIVTVCNKGSLSKMGDFWVPWNMLGDEIRSLECVARFVLDHTSEYRFSRVEQDIISTEICHDGGEQDKLTEEERSDRADEATEERLERALKEQKVMERYKRMDEKMSKKRKILVKKIKVMEERILWERLSLGVVSDEDLLLRLNDSDFMETLKRMAGKKKNTPERGNPNRYHPDKRYVNKRKAGKYKMIQQRLDAQAAQHKRDAQATKHKRDAQAAKHRSVNT
ncbi:hypothetical protein MFRU_006g00490 [Monilinia fructicola]|uniref:C2H2-type domain-containing protein n=1 Tax=Monilinia fructicola TaxID=38448 RepID=A0A5M9JE45_MONFR|nr:hypothetical protein EYC84_009325 [Monilinia fructicola]KAG4032578.1 hypothetical protein MFRU_006g00490 [Monilinia fructicola]